MYFPMRTLSIFVGVGRGCGWSGWHHLLSCLAMFMFIFIFVVYICLCLCLCSCLDMFRLCLCSYIHSFRLGLCVRMS